MKKNHNKLIQFFLTILLLISLTSCQSDSSESPVEVPNNQPADGFSDSEPGSQPEKPVTSSSGASEEQEEATNPDTIQVQWQSSAHANTYVVDGSGKNNSCAKCHAPIEWVPTIDDLPESCFTCKFELSEPPSIIEETTWQSIPCMVCHQTDKKGNVVPEVSWLEVAALEEYSAVANANELCSKCHMTSNIKEHISVEVNGAHADFLCTDCHNAHALSTSCGESTCHESLQDPAKIIPGHDDKHKNVACEACHDASGMDVGPDKETGIWTTFANWTYEWEGISESGSKPFVSHNTVLAAKCERCHFENNPWNLTLEIETQ